MTKTVLIFALISMGLALVFYFTFNKDAVKKMPFAIGDSANASIPDNQGALNSIDYAPRVAAIKNRDDINNAQLTDMLRALEDEFKEDAVYFIGKITRIDGNSYGGKYNVHLTHENGHKAECVFDRNKRDAVYALRVGQYITVIGKLYFFTLGGKFVSLKECGLRKGE